MSAAKRGNFLKTIVKAKNERAKPAEAPAPPQYWTHEFPLVWDFLTLSSVDGEPRATGTLMIFAGESGLKILLLDKETGMRCFRNVGEGSPLQAAQDVLIDEEADWRPDPNAGEKAAKRGRRGR